MPTEFAFRLSMYLTLGFACLSLGYAEWDFLPEASIFAGMVIVLLVISFFCEGRYVLDLRAANQLGFGIGLLAVVWMAYQFIRKDSLIYTFPWPASLLPFLGPLLMILMPAKLFRPKHIGDWWAMQGLGLAAAGLATAMAEDLLFGLILSGYTLMVVWSLTLFYFRRSAGLLPAITPDPNEPVPIVVTSAQFVGRVLVARAVLLRSLGWMSAAMLLSLPLFFFTPRSQAPRWKFAQMSIETGLGEGQVDLTRTGQMRENRDIAFTVDASNSDGRAKEDISPNQRWRAAHYQLYSEGSWRFKSLEGRKFLIDRNSMVLAVRGPEDKFPPQLDPKQYYLDFSPKIKTLYRIVKDPVRWEAGKVVPVSSYFADRMALWSQSLDGHFVPAGQSQYHRQVSYDRPGDPDLGSPCVLAEDVQKSIFAGDPETPLTTFKRIVGLPRIREYAVELLTKLARQDPELQRAIERGDNRTLFELNPIDYEKVARAYSRFLSESGEFTYSMTLTRTDTSIDPIQDFLLITKSGQCERFATALTLLCRSVGIPAVYVIGYKGCEATEFPGLYNIRQNAAHAWVEVFIPRPQPDAVAGDGGTAYVWHWLSLDPTPQLGEDPSTGTLGDWLGNAKETSVEFFLDFIVGYNPERRVRTVKAIMSWLAAWWWTILLIPMSVALVWLGQHLIRRRTESGGSELQGLDRTGLDWFDQLRTILNERNLDLPPGTTWLEHLPTIQLVLGPDSPASAAATDLIQAFYQARYAGKEFANSQELLKLAQMVEHALDRPPPATVTS